MNRKTLLKAMLCLLPFIAYAQNDRQTLAAKDTRKGYDLRGQGFNAALQFVYQDPKKYPVMIGVATKDEKFMAAVIKIVQEMDRDGYEDLGLMFLDMNYASKGEVPSHEIIFFRNGEPTGLIIKTSHGWTFGSFDSTQKTSAAPLNDDLEYPITLIRTKIRTTHEGSGARNYTQGIQN